jgi:hypothetical protein
MPAETRLFLCRSDNFGVLLHDPASGATASIDAPEAAPIEAALKATGWKLTDILVTHHHADHTQGIAPLKAETGCTVIGPKAEAAKIQGLDKTVGGGDKFTFSGHDIEVIDTPGHTAGHITYWVPGSKVAFAGDTLFAVGCGRVIEGDMKMMWESLSRLAKLPGDWKLKGMTTKYIFRAALQGLLPEKIIHRGKQGYSLPVKHLLRGELKDYMVGLLNDSPIIRETMNVDYVNRLIREHLAASHNHNHILWALLSVAIWHNRFFPR